MKHISGALDALLYDNQHDKDDPDYLRNHPGGGGEPFAAAYGRLGKHGRLSSHTVEEFATVLKTVRAEYDKRQTLCESPIERTLLAGLMTANWHFLDNPFVPVVDLREKAALPDAPVAIIPQFPVMGYRLDFALAVKGEDKAFLWALECDGGEYHDAVKDAERDANLARLGIRTFRFSGSSLYKDPVHCADLMVGEVWFWLTQR